MAINMIESSRDNNPSAHLHETQKHNNNNKMDNIISQVSDIKLKEDENKGPAVYDIEKAPQCNECINAGKKFFEFECAKCEAIVANDGTSIGQLLAIARQWTPSVQNKMNVLIMEMLRRGATADDRDALTDMTLLHFVCKSGAAGMGNAENAMETAEFLIEKAGANPNLTCRWNDMTALHIATYYDVAPVVGYLVTVVAPKVLDQPCAYLESKTPLHIAASNLCLKSAKVLLGAGANVLLKDQQDRTPLDCVPDDDHLENAFAYNMKKHEDIALELRTMLEEATLTLSGEQSTTDMETMKTAKVVLSALGYEIGDRVMVGKQKIGYLRYCGPTQFASGIWTGVELEEPIGKHDGSIDGIQYFNCPPNHGIFAPLNKISKLDADDYDLLKPSQINGKWHHSYSTSGIDMSSVHSKIDTGLNRQSRFSEANGILSSSSSSVNSEDVHIGSRVFLSDKKSGIVRFIGITKFAPGIWYGIELTRPLGKNDGSLQGVRYFHCPDMHGVFVQFPRIVRLCPPTSRKTISSSYASPPDTFESDETGSEMSMTISGTSSLDVNINPSIANGHDRPSLKPTNMNTSLMTTSSYNLSSTLRRTMSLRRPTTKATANSKEQSWLRVGVNVLVNGMVACVRFIGAVHFTDGIFLGLELRTPNGKNDGTIDGVRYFTCKPNYGLLVRPQKVTVRGINASKLLSDEVIKGSIVKSKEI